MPVFFYKAKNFKGREETGILEAENKIELSRILRKKGFFLLKAKEEKKEKGKISLFLLLSQRISDKEKLFFTKNLKIMLQTGVPLARAFQILAEQSKNRNFKKILKKTAERIRQGEKLSQILKSYPKVFPAIYLETIKVGEETGELEKALQLLEVQIERIYNLKQKVKSAMIYPLMVISFTILIGVFMFVFAVPKLKEAFENLGVELPITTKIMLALGENLSGRWYIFLIILPFFGYLIFKLFKTKIVKKYLSKIFLKMPIFSNLIKKINSGIVLRTLSSLLRAGVPIVKALKIASGSVGNEDFKRSLEESAEIVKRGEKLSLALKKYQQIYSAMALEMIKIGEETGETSKMLEELADFYEREIGDTLNKISSIIEPILIIFVGSIVGFFVISMMLPLFNVMRTL